MKSILSNYLLIVGLVAWLSAQLIKLIITFTASKKIVWSLLWSSGGMPSSHTSLVCALTIGVAKIYGVASPAFALVLFGSLIVVHDALGVRRQAGEHAKALNTLFCQMPQMSDVTANHYNTEKVFYELIGHTPIQVFFGALSGLVIGLFIPVY